MTQQTVLIAGAIGYIGCYVVSERSSVDASKNW
jgi:UDP-glucose 4-epimerase